jgi:hypothetical protein
MLSELIQRVVARYAARYVNVPPWKIGPCKHCGGAGVHVEAPLQVKGICVKCWGTGSDPDDVGALREETQNLGLKYQQGMADFEKEKAPYRGRSVRRFGPGRGMDLQTLRITWTTREEQLKHEDKRIEMGKDLAKFAAKVAG